MKNFYVVGRLLYGNIEFHDGSEVIEIDSENGKAYREIINFHNDEDIRYIFNKPLLWEGDWIYYNEDIKDWLIVDDLPVTTASQILVSLKDNGKKYEELDDEMKKVWDENERILNEYPKNPRYLNYLDTQTYLRLRKSLEENNKLQELIG